MLLNVLLWSISIILLGLSFPSGPWHKFWLLELFVEAGYLWFATLTLLLLSSLLLLRLFSSRRKFIIVLIIALGSYASSILIWYVPRLSDMRTGGIPISVMTYNVNHQRWNTRAVTETVREHPVDIFGLVEPFKEQAAELRDNVRDLYPEYYRATGGGLSLFSRYAIVEAATEHLDTADSSLFAVLDIGGNLVQVVVTHPLVPVTKQNFIRRNKLIAALANYAHQQQQTTIILGDFNATSWSIYLRNFMHRSRLRSVALGHGIYPTWFYLDSRRSPAPAERFKQLLKIPIDRIFVSKSVRVDRVITAPSGASDHRPLIANLRVPQISPK